MLTRRNMIATATAGAATTLFAPAIIARPAGQAFYATQDDPYPIEPIGNGVIPNKYMRQIVPYANNLNPGAIVVDNRNRFLYVKIDPGRAMRFGVAVGKAGFDWSGHASIQRKVMWPKWTPPREMIERTPETAQVRQGHARWAGKPVGRPRAVPLQGRQGHPLPDSRHQQPDVHRQGRVVRLHPNAQRGYRGRLQRSRDRHRRVRAVDPGW
jgi:lipoprotein-anchoring transpeptidase ErfK/SrfK